MESSYERPAMSINLPFSIDQLDEWREFTKRDDACDHMVPSDVRALIGEIERLRNECGKLKMEIASMENDHAYACKMVAELEASE
jgi:hypothetical protein